MPFQLGLAHLLVALAGLWFGRKKRLLRVVAAAYGALIFMMIPFANSLWTHRPLIYLQFPWRLLAVVGVFQVMMASGLASLWRTHRWRRAALWGAILVATAIGQKDQFVAVGNRTLTDEQILATADQLSQKLTTFTDKNEFLPRTARQRRPRPRGQAPLVRAPAGVRVEFATGNSPYDIAARIATAGPVAITIAQLYFPGWCVDLDGRELSAHELARQVNAAGLMGVVIPSAGVHRLVASYAGPPGGAMRNGCAAAALFVLLGFFLWEWRRYRSGPMPVRTGPTAVRTGATTVPTEPRLD